MAARWAVGFCAGLIAPYAIFMALTLWLSRLILPPEGAERAFHRVYELLPGLIPVIMAVAVIVRRPRWRAAGILGLVSSVASYLVVLGWSNFPFPGNVTTFNPPSPRPSLISAAPYFGDQVNQPLSVFTADELNRLGQGRRAGWPVTYVPADVPSTGALVVSVNPISDRHWGAAALSPRGRCYLILVVRDRAASSRDQVYYGWLPPGQPCVGSAATPSTVTEVNWPPGYY